MTSVFDGLAEDRDSALQTALSASSVPSPDAGTDARTARLNIDPAAATQDLACLVLTIVELLRQLMERQAVRRIDQGDLGPDREERLGTALMLLDERMTELCESHGLRREDLNLDLGPLGTLLGDGRW